MSLMKNFIYASNRFTYCDVWRDENLCEINLCERGLTRIIRINKTRAKKLSLYGTTLGNMKEFICFVFRCVFVSTTSTL